MPKAARRRLVYDGYMEETAARATAIRESILRMLNAAGSGHSGGPLGAADIWATLFFGGIVRYKADDPWWEERDRVVVSAGHYAPVVYATLAEAGYFPKAELEQLRWFRSRLQGHPQADYQLIKAKNRLQLPGIETDSGSLGQGLSQAVGMAIAGRMDRKTFRVYCFMSDAELQEGQTWEALMLAGNLGLGNLTVMIDRNKIQVGGSTEEVAAVEPVYDKLRAFKTEVEEVDGHDYGEMAAALKRAAAITERPSAIIFKTIAGKGVEFMEGDYSWHGKAPDDTEADRAIGQLRGQL